MGSQDTNLGGEGRAFPKTTWGLISGLGGAAAESRAALETLARRYWKPIYTYLRAGWSKSNEDAKDLTQAFLLWLAEGEALARYQPDRGSFRTYLKTVLRSFVNHSRKAMETLKRGGGASRIPLEGLDALPDPATPEPDRAFDLAWRSEFLRRGVDRIRERYRSRGEERAFRIYEAYDLSTGATPPTYARLAAEQGMTVNQVEHLLFTIRGELREELRRELSDTTADAQGLQEEWNELFGA